jgi:YD repeat-containing protein
VNLFRFLIVLALLTPTAAHAQQREFYDTRTGKSIGRATTDSGGASVFYDASGRVTGRSATDSQGVTVIYDAPGNRVGTVTTQQKREKP